MDIGITADGRGRFTVFEARAGWCAVRRWGSRRGYDNCNASSRSRREHIMRPRILSTRHSAAQPEHLPISPRSQGCDEGVRTGRQIPKRQEQHDPEIAAIIRERSRKTIHPPKRRNPV